MDIPSAFTTSAASLPIRTRTPDILGPSEPSTPGSSGLDSGYASLLTTPEKPSNSSDSFDFGSSYTLDSTAGDAFEKLFKDDLAECPRSAFLTPHRKFLNLASSSLKASANNTRPQSIRANSGRASSLRQPHRSRGSLSSTFYSKTLPRATARQRSESLLQLPAPSTLPSSIRAPDRFVHPRDSECAAFPIGEKFRLTKATNELSSSEKIARRNKVSEDAFSFQERHSNPAPTFANERQYAFAMSGHPAQTRARTTLGTGTFDDDPETEFLQRVNRGSVWSISTIPPVIGAVNNGHGAMTQSGTSFIPFFTSPFAHVPRYNARMLDKHPSRLAAALDFDRTSRLLQCNVDKGVFHLQSDNIPSSPSKKQKLLPKTEKTKWSGAGWVNESLGKKPKKVKPASTTEARPIRILSAPKYRDDFYCTLLAYSPTTNTMAVGLCDLLYTWTEAEGAVHINGSDDPNVWLTSLAFSSVEGGRGILAYGRSNRTFGLMAISEANNSRLIVEESAAITSLAWRPICTMRPSRNPNKKGRLVNTEDLLVGLETGQILYYVVEWPDKSEIEKDHWFGDIKLVAHMSIHDQQVCGLAWAPDGQSFATGGNDNQFCYFYVDAVLPRCHRSGGDGKLSEGIPRASLYSDLADSLLMVQLSNGSEVRERIKGEKYVRHLKRGSESWRWEHGAAVKAIAFCPWQEGLVATGGGSNDRCVRFFHTTSGSPLATIFVASQVTSLIWSTTRKEIAVTFGFTHPGHNIRIAVYSWPDCKQVAAVPWENKKRALYGISCSQGRRQYSLTPDETTAETMREGCIAVASSDENIQFYELWPNDNKPVISGEGMLGGSSILEDLEGIQKEGDIIR